MSGQEVQVGGLAQVPGKDDSSMKQGSSHVHGASARGWSRRASHSWMFSVAILS